MKPIKMFGLAALAALMAMAFISASSAMAEDTALCSNDSSTECTAITHVHETSVSKAKLLTTFLTIECDVLFLGDAAEGHEGSAVVVEGTFTYTNCGSCTATEENGPAEISVLKLGHETADVTGEGLVHVVCGESLDCAYNGVGLKGTGKGPLLSTQKNGEVTLTKVTTNKEAGGFLCPSESKLDLTTTPLVATYIAAGLHYCVDYAQNKGLYENSNCATQAGTFTKLYELVVGPRGWILNSEHCLRRVGLNGLWQTSICTADAAGSRYEIGKVTTIQ